VEEAVNEARQPGWQVISNIFQHSLSGLAARQTAKAEQLRTIERIPGALLEVLATSPMGKDPVTTMKLRAIIAAGFEAAVSDFEREHIEGLQDAL
jgi:hypothetical protein